MIGNDFYIPGDCLLIPSVGNDIKKISCRWFQVDEIRRVFSDKLNIWLLDVALLFPVSIGISEDQIETIMATD